MADRLIAQLSRRFMVIALLLPLWAHAQSAQLYLVELLVFSQPSGGSAEHWDAIPELAYPNKTRFLIHPGEQAAPTPASSIPAPSPVSATIPGGSTPIASTALPGPVQPALFTALPREQQQFSGKAAAMQRSGRYRILFHEAWMQPMYSQAETVPIVLDRSGDGGAWPALQGTIKLYLSRYLYLETNLWLNTQGEYLQGSWRMPAPPLAPVSSARENVMATGPGQFGTPAPVQSASQPAAAGAQTATMNNAPFNRGTGENDTLVPDYPFRHAVLLKQTRRLRSGETVYVDHPLLGVLVRVSPVAASTPAPIE